MQVNKRLLTTILYLHFLNCLKKISDSVVCTNSLEREIPLDSGFKRRRFRRPVHWFRVEGRSVHKKVCDFINIRFTKQYNNFFCPDSGLAKGTRLIHHKQLLMNKFGRILCLTRK